MPAPPGTDVSDTAEKFKKSRVSKIASKARKQSNSPVELAKQRDMWGNALAVSALVTLALQVAVCEIKHVNQDTDITATTTMKAGCSVLTLSTLVMLFMYYYVDFALARKTMRVLEGDTIWSTGQASSFIIEAIVLCIHSPMGLKFDIKSYALSVDDSRHGWSDVSHSSDDFICALMITRIYVIWRVVRGQFGLNSELARSVAMWYQETMDNRFMIKAVMHKNQLGFVMWTFVITVVAMGYVFMIFERQVDPAFASYSSAMWFVVVTVTTVGYGDMVPHTVFGRALAVIICIGALCWIALLIAGILNNVDLSNRQKKVVHLVSNARSQQELKKRAGNAMAQAWKSYLKGDDDANAPDLSPDLCKKLRHFRGLRKELSVPSEDETALLFAEMLTVRSHSEDMFKHVMGDVKGLQDKVGNLEKKLEKQLEAMSETMTDTLAALKGQNEDLDSD